MADLKKKAWDTFSKWIRARDKKCITCNVNGSGSNYLQAGHFWHGVLDFDEENINAQCVHCNKYLSGNGTHYSVYLLNKLGKKGFDALNIRHTKAIGGEKRTDEQYNEIIKKYKKF